MKRLIFIFFACLGLLMSTSTIEAQDAPKEYKTYLKNREKELEEKAKNDDLDAITQLIGFYLTNHYGYPANPGKAAKWGRKKIDLLKKLGENGDNIAYAHIFLMYYYGNEGVGQDPNLAKIYLDQYLANIKDVNSLSKEEKVFVAKALNCYDTNKAVGWLEPLIDNDSELLAVYILIKYFNALQPDFKTLSRNEVHTAEQIKEKLNYFKISLDNAQGEILKKMSRGGGDHISELFNNAYNHYEENSGSFNISNETSILISQLKEKLKFYSAINAFDNSPEKLYELKKANLGGRVPIEYVDKYIEIVKNDPRALQQFIFFAVDSKDSEELKINNKILEILENNKEELLQSENTYNNIKAMFAIVDNDIEKAKSLAENTHLIFALDYLKNAQTKHPENNMVKEAIDYYGNYYGYEAGDWLFILSHYRKFYDKYKKIETPQINYHLAKVIDDGQNTMGHVNEFTIDEFVDIYKRSGMKNERIDRMVSQNQGAKEYLAKAKRGDYQAMQDLVMAEWDNIGTPDYLYDFVKKLISKGNKEAMWVLMMWKFFGGPGQQALKNHGFNDAYIFSTAQKLAAKDPKYNYFIGECYKYGVGCTTNRNTAARYYDKAYKSGWKR